MNNQDKIIECLLNRVYSFYPGLAGEYGIVVDSLGDYTQESIQSFLIELKYFKRELALNYDENFLIIKRINKLIDEIEYEYHARNTEYYYSRAFLTLYESLSTTNSKEKNNNLFKLRLGCLEKIVIQANSNIKDEYLSKIEILNTRKKFNKTCNLIEEHAKTIIDDRYYRAKHEFKEFLEKELKKAKFFGIQIDDKRFTQMIENTCDRVLSLNQVWNELLELAIELNAVCCENMINADSDCLKIDFNAESITNWICYVKKMFDGLEKTTNEIKRLDILNETAGPENRSYRAAIKIDNAKAFLSINKKVIDSNEKMLEIIIHEILPGHFLMSKYYNGKNNIIFKERSFWEGWALFCEYYSIKKSDSKLYRVSVAKKLISNVLVGIVSIKWWYFKESEKEICEWLKLSYNISADEAKKMLITSVIELEERMDYFVGFAVFYKIFKTVGFESLYYNVMHSGASFYILDKNLNKNLVLLEGYEDD